MAGPGRREQEGTKQEQILTKKDKITQDEISKQEHKRNSAAPENREENQTEGLK